MNIVSKARKFVDDVKEVAGFIVTLPASLAVTGGVLRGIGSTIANDRVAKVVTSIGTSALKSAQYLSKLYKGVAVQTTKKAIVPAAKAVGRALPFSKYIAPMVKFIPTVAAATASIALGAKAVRDYSNLSKALQSPMAKLDFKRPDITSAEYWFGQIKDVFNITNKEVIG